VNLSKQGESKRLEVCAELLDLAEAAGSWAPKSLQGKREHLRPPPLAVLKRLQPRMRVKPQRLATLTISSTTPRSTSRVHADYAFFILPPRPYIHSHGYSKVACNPTPTLAFGLHPITPVQVSLSLGDGASNQRQQSTARETTGFRWPRCGFRYPILVMPRH